MYNVHSANQVNAGLHLLLAKSLTVTLMHYRNNCVSSGWLDLKKHHMFEVKR